MKLVFDISEFFHLQNRMLLAYISDHIYIFQIDIFKIYIYMLGLARGELVGVAWRSCKALNVELEKRKMTRGMNVKVRRL